MSSETNNNQPEQPAGSATAGEQCAQNTGECPEVHLAAEAVRLAKIELQKAQKFYDNVCCQATEKIKAARRPPSAK